MSRCPKCKTVELRTAGRGGTPVLRCYQCHGMWVSLEEAQDLLMRGTLSDPESMLPQKVDADGIAGLCPEGHGILARARVDGPDPFYLERCSTCLGYWFDGGEWARVASLNLASNLADLWDPDRRRKLMHERIETGIRARMVADLGAELVDRIDAVVRDIQAHPKRREAAGYIKQKLGL